MFQQLWMFDNPGELEQPPAPVPVPQRVDRARATHNTSGHPVKRRSLIDEVLAELRRTCTPYVAVNDVKRKLFTNSQLRAFHFVVYAKEGPNWLIWCGDPSAAVREDMRRWEQVFGEGFQTVYALRRAAGIVYRTAAGVELKVETH